MIDIREQIAKIDAQLLGLLIERRIFEQALGEKVKAPFRRTFEPDEYNQGVTICSHDARLIDPWFCRLGAISGGKCHLVGEDGKWYDLSIEGWELFE